MRHVVDWNSICLSRLSRWWAACHTSPSLSHRLSFSPPLSLFPPLSLPSSLYHASTFLVSFLFSYCKSAQAVTFYVCWHTYNGHCDTLCRTCVCVCACVCVGVCVRMPVLFSCHSKDYAGLCIIFAVTDVHLHPVGLQCLIKVMPSRAQIA